MISAQDWWNVFAHYNEILYPAQWIVMAVAAILVVWLFRRPSTTANRVVMSFLSLANLWNGLTFFVVIGTGLPSPLRFFQGGLFIAAGLFLGLDAIQGKAVMALNDRGIWRNMTILLLLAVFSYPFIGLLRGHSVFQLVYPGTLPCATASLSLLLLSTALPRTNKPAYILLLIWAIPFAPLIQIPVFKVYEDVIMFVVGIYALVRFLHSLFKTRVRKTTA